MTKALPLLNRRFLLLLSAGVSLGLSPVGFGNDPVTGEFRFGPALAWADSGSDQNDPDEPDEPDQPDDPEKPEDSDDNSGPGGGDDNDTDSDVDDSDEDSGGSGTGGGDDGSGGTGGGGTGGGGTGGGGTGGGGTGGGSGTGSGTGSGQVGGTGTQGGAQIGNQQVSPVSSSGRNQLRNVTVRYPDGWIELILNDQYQLIDNLDRQVILRPATIEDFNRMVALGS